MMDPIERVSQLDKGELEVDVKPTEDSEKLKTSLQKLFPDSELALGGPQLTGNTDLSYFKGLLEKQRIRATICSILDANFSAGSSFIDISKLACEAGKVAVDADFPLGRIRLHVAWQKVK